MVSLMKARRPMWGAMGSMGPMDVVESEQAWLEDGGRTLADERTCWRVLAEAVRGEKGNSLRTGGVGYMYDVGGPGHARLEGFAPSHAKLRALSGRGGRGQVGV